MVIKSLYNAEQCAVCMIFLYDFMCEKDCTANSDLVVEGFASMIFFSTEKFEGPAS